MGNPGIWTTLGLNFLRMGNPRARALGICSVSHIVLSAMVGETPDPGSEGTLRRWSAAPSGPPTDTDAHDGMHW